MRGLTAILIGCLAGCGGTAPSSTSTPASGKADSFANSPSLSATSSSLSSEFDLWNFMYTNVVDTVYPQLQDYTLSLLAFDSTEDFFRADVTIASLLTSAPNRTYRLRYNSELLKDPPSDLAVQGILVHELSHILDYTQDSSFQIIGIGLSSLCTDNADYEHHTDETALMLGFSKGLKAYRTWLYAHVAPEYLDKKKRVYYTSDEIDAWVAANPEWAQRP